MKHRDFHAGQSALGLMTRNTEAMFAPRMAQWEAFGKGLQDANAIIQNRHAFNEQLAQNQKQNEFKEREFGFKEKQAEEAKRQFDTQFQENQRQFGLRHALDKQNSAYDNQLKQSQADYNWWRMQDEQKEKQRSLTLKTKGIVDDITRKLQVLQQGEDLIKMAPEYLGMGLHMGFNKTLNGLWGINGFWELNKKQNEFVGKLNAYKHSYLHDKFKNNISESKIKENNEFLDQKWAGNDQFSVRVAETGKDVISRLENQIKGLQSMGVNQDYLDEVEKQVKQYKAFYSKYNQENAKPTLRKIPTKKELESNLIE